MRYRFLPFFIVLVFVGLAYTACKKIDTTDVGGDLIPAVDNVTTFDTVLDIITNTETLYDSARILRSEDHALGIIGNDPDFGKTKAEIYFLPGPDGFGTHPFAKKDSTIVFDSVVLALAYTGYYGDTNSLQRVNVFEINSDNLFRPNAFGYPVDSSDGFVDPTVLGTRLMDFKTLDDSVFDNRKRDTIKIKNQLRIQLNKSLGNRFLSYDTAHAYKSDSFFREYFKGFAIKIDEAGSPVKNGLAYFNLANANTKMIFYYRVLNGSTVTDTLATEFPFTSFNYSNANTIKRTPANGLATTLNNGLPNDELLYVQSSPGTKITIRIPGLKNLSNRIIHRAELIFNVVNNVPEPVYGAPVSLFLDAEDTANKRILAVPYDFSYENAFQDIVGGFQKNGQYTFNMSRYVQSIVTRQQPDYTFRLTAPFRTNATELRGTATVTPYPPAAKSGYPINTPIAKGRVVLAGAAYPVANKRARLRIVYSKI